MFQPLIFRVKQRPTHHFKFISTNTPYGSEFNSGIGQFNEEIVYPIDGTVEIKVAGELNEERVTSDPINITFDIFKPKISTSISK